MTTSDPNYKSYSHSHALGGNTKSNSISNVILLIWGVGPLALLDSDSVKSSTPSTSSSNEGQLRSWECAKVGLSIIQSLETCSKFSGKILHALESKKTSLALQMITKTPYYMGSAQASKPSHIFPKCETDVVFEIVETLIEHKPNRTVPASLFGLTGSNFEPDEFIKSLLATGIENSEDYTCVISHGPNPKITHIYKDQILKVPEQYPPDYFLSFCSHCKNKLEEGKDVYMYRGDNAFCSVNCRTAEIMMDEKLEKSNASSENS